jgi:hypothetical protein
MVMQPKKCNRIGLLNFDDLFGKCFLVFYSNTDLVLMNAIKIRI